MTPLTLTTLTTLTTRLRGSALRLFLLAGAFALPIGASGCTRVRPYQRGVLAHPTMLLISPAGPAESHVYAIQEGASGGGSGAEGGCGCN